MKHAIVLGTAGVVVSFAMLGAGFLAGSKTVTPPAPQPVAANTLDQGAVEQIVRNYLINNPEVMFEVQAALEAKQQEQQLAAQRQTIEESGDNIFHAAYDGVVGNPDGKVTIVEFFDYNCHYCKKALGDMQALVVDNPDLRFVLKEFPILGADSQKATIVSMAFHKLMPEKYSEFHTQLLGAPGRASEEAAIKIAVSLGADEAALQEAMKDDTITASINDTYELAKKLEITGTPSYVIGNEVVFGALGRELLSHKVEEVRACVEQGNC